MSMTDEDRQPLIAKVRQFREERRAAEERELIPPSMLRALRNYECISQEGLARRISNLGTQASQKDISLLELGKPNRVLQIAISRHFRSLGHDVDPSGNSICIRPHQSNERVISENIE